MVITFPRHFAEAGCSLAAVQVSELSASVLLPGGFSCRKSLLPSRQLAAGAERFHSEICCLHLPGSAGLAFRGGREVFEDNLARSILTKKVEGET